MNAGTQTARSAPRSFVPANESQTQNAEFPVDFQDLCSFAMDQALGIEKASLSTVVSLNSCVLDICQEALWFTPVFGNLFEIVSQAIELQVSWLTLMAPYASSTVASNCGRQAVPAEEGLAHCMDIAIGERLTAPSSTVTSISRGQAQRQAKKADVLERGMDIAIGMRKAA